MPLTTCPDCNSQVSQKAKACPKCGRPTDTQPYGIALLLFTGMTLIGIWLYFNLIFSTYGLIVITLGYRHNQKIHIPVTNFLLLNDLNSAL